MVVIVIEFILILNLLYTQVKNWVKELRKMLGNEICLCIVGKHHYFLKMSFVSLNFLLKNNKYLTPSWTVHLQSYILGLQLFIWSNFQTFSSLMIFFLGLFQRIVCLLHLMTRIQALLNQCILTWLSFLKSSHCAFTNFVQDCVHFLAAMSSQYLFYLDYS